ncbi:DUF885 domain-containing protein [Flavisolibacter tropicus]|uniref:Lipoprotein n=1 Tax=Flavisolibacter tropicus TaxID=1492898 RepID=A0A172TX86_9BACT|nr:DUF885 domain-containing protein [Flavisolibacter tropicus]ANE51650.1 hypothetical protein SY85_15220 [Flavisolibacter tropicus]
MRYLWTFLLAATLGACNDSNIVAGSNAETKGDEKLAKLFDNYWEQRMQLFPLEATQNGDNRYNDRLTLDISAPFLDTLRTFYSNYLQQIQQFDRTKLTANDQISYDIFKREMEMQQERLQFNEYQIPFQQFWGMPLTMGQLGSGASNQPFVNAQDYRNWLERVKGFAAWADTAIANFRKGMASGNVLPRALVVKMIPQMQDMANPDTAKNVFFGPLRKMPADVVGDTALQRAFMTTMNTYVLPAYKRLGVFLQNEYLPKARTTTGVSSLPNGTAYYNYLVRYWTTTDKSADEIYNTGLSEVKRIRGEMEKVKAQVGFQGDLNAFFIHLKNDPKLMPYKTPEDVLNAFRAIQQKMEPNLKNMFGRTPKTPFEIRQTEAFRAASAAAEYQPGTPDGKRPGIFYVPILDATTFNVTSGMESLFLHEAIPGHHYQISLQQENESLPKFRRFSWYGAYGEGWALYTESLGKELGLYTDPYQYMGALGDEIHRAIRLVVDVGMHMKGMSREEAIKYMMDNEAISEQGATAEIERYMAIPAQALSYKIGALKIRELRDKYTKQLGNKFKLSDFHDEFLKDGVMPLDIIERKMDAWAAGVAAKKA